MDKVEVFLFKTFDVDSGKMVLSKQYATRDAIKKLSATPVEEAKMLIDPSLLDDHGMYVPDQHDERSLPT
ncbi:MAG TPA: hypothetical protein VJ910_05555 [Desulfuromonadales bacterium]|nr:hypothetical protein [Desulfuromonadales bacterium]